MRYLLSRIKSDRAERIYRIYVTDALYYQGQNKTIAERYVDILNPKPKDTRSAEEIVQDVTSRIGLQVV